MEEESVVFVVVRVNRFTTIPRRDYSVLVPDLLRFAVVYEPNCSLNWQLTVRRREDNYRREARVVVGRFGQVVEYYAEFLEFNCDE